MNIPGRKITPRRAIVSITELSCLLSIAIALIAALSLLNWWNASLASLPVLPAPGPTTNLVVSTLIWGSGEGGVNVDDAQEEILRLKGEIMKARLRKVGGKELERNRQLENMESGKRKRSLSMKKRQRLNLSMIMRLPTRRWRSSMITRAARWIMEMKMVGRVIIISQPFPPLLRIGLVNLSLLSRNILLPNHLKKP
jgi:hypothetical protein